jgi:hypothetical protein
MLAQICFYSEMGFFLLYGCLLIPQRFSYTALFFLIGIRRGDEDAGINSFSEKLLSPNGSG